MVCIFMRFMQECQYAFNVFMHLSGFCVWLYPDSLLFSVYQIPAMTGGCYG